MAKRQRESTVDRIAVIGAMLDITGDSLRKRARRDPSVRRSERSAVDGLTHDARVLRLEAKKASRAAFLKAESGAFISRVDGGYK